MRGFRGRPRSQGWQALPGAPSDASVTGGTLVPLLKSGGAVTSVLPAVLSLAVIDAVNPASITGAIYLAGTGRNARLRLFILAVYSTYLLVGLALTLGPAMALRSALVDTPTLFGPIVEVAVGVLLVAIGIRTWRQRASRRSPRPRAAPTPRRSALSLGVLTTLADLPTAGPLLVASALIAGSNANAWTQVTDLSLYNVVYISPLLAIALAHTQAAKTANATTGRSHNLLALGPALVAGLCVAGGTTIGCQGVAALI